MQETLPGWQKKLYTAPPKYDMNTSGRMSGREPGAALLAP
jgi:hypothetical protein